MGDMQDDDEQVIRPYKKLLALKPRKALRDPLKPCGWFAPVFSGVQYQTISDNVAFLSFEDCSTWSVLF